MFDMKPWTPKEWSDIRVEASQAFYQYDYSIKHQDSALDLTKYIADLSCYYGIINEPCCFISRYPWGWEDQSIRYVKIGHLWMFPFKFLISSTYLYVVYFLLSVIKKNKLKLNQKANPEAL